MRTKTGASLGGLVLACISIALIAVGSFGPWATLGVFHANGLDNGRDGWLTLILAACAAVSIWRYFVRPRRFLAVGLFVQAAAAVVVGAYDAHDITSRHVSFLGTDLNPSVGWGIWLVLIAGIVLAIDALVLAFGQAPAPARATADAVAIQSAAPSPLVDPSTR